MFSGIVETIGRVKEIRLNGSNRTFTIESKIAAELRVEQSVAHNGVCLTVETLGDGCFTVTAIDETLSKSNLGLLRVGDEVNLERAMRADGMLDGHIVQGHVDTTATCREIVDRDGSKYFTFEYFADKREYVTVDKGSVCVNGVSLTVVDSAAGRFRVAIIPFTIENTNFHTFEVGSVVNLEFDILGKYIMKYIDAYVPSN